MSASTDLFYGTLLAQYLDAGVVVARDWLTTEIRGRLAKPGCRFVLLIGEPGAGKTGLMAALARANPGWLRYFIRSDSTTPLSGADATSLMLRLGHQLAHRRPDLFNPELLAIEVKQRVEQVAPGGTVVGVRIEDLTISPFYRTAIRVQQEVTTLSGGLAGVEISRATVEPRLLELSTLSHLALLDPALVLARKQPEETIVALIDALDEVLGMTGITTILDWLESVPEPAPNLRFVMTSRPDARLDAFVDVRGPSVERIRLEPASDAVTNDVRTFATKLLEETGALNRGPKPVHSEIAIPSLARAALGNFAYLSAYARSLRAALASGSAEQLEELLQFETLPSGLEQLYISFARRMRRQIEKLGQLEVESPRDESDEFVPAWEGVGQRFLGVLVVAFDPLELEQLVAIGGVRVWQRSASNVLERLVPFLDKTSTGWRLFHPSVSEVLSGAAKKSAADVAIDAREWHTRIARDYQGKVPWDKVDWEAMDSYGLRNVARHVAQIQADPAVLCELITYGLRTASRKRFFSDLPFRRVIETARAHMAETRSLGAVFSEGIFLQLVLSGLGSGAQRLAPAVYGLMARVGRVEEALARTQVLEPSLFRYRAVEAIWRSTPATLRDRLGPLDGVELLIGEALEIPRTDSPMPGFLGMDFMDCLCDAALALVPGNIDRALRLIALTEPYDRKKVIRDRFLDHAIPLAPPQRALELLPQMSNGQSSAAISVAERAAPVAERDRLIAIVREHLEEEEQSAQGPILARLIVLLGKEASSDVSALEKWVKAQSTSSGAWGVVWAAETLHASDPDLAERILQSCDQPKLDSLLSSALIAAARLWAEWGKPEESRLRLNRALEEFRHRGWYGPADDMIDAAIVASRFDAPWSEALTEEAFRLVASERKTSDRWERDKLEMTLSSMISRLRTWKRSRALELAHCLTGGWIHGGSWDSTDGRTSSLAVIGLDAAEDDATLAAQLLAECTAAERAGVRFGRPDAALPPYGLFRVVAPDNETTPASTSRRDNFISYLSNSVNYWLSGRKWRFFDTPASVLRSMDAVFPANASWARVVASAVVHVARTDADRAMALAFWSADAAERLVGLAPLTIAFDEADERLRTVRRTLIATKKEVPRYEPEVDLRPVPQAPVLFYLNPAYRAQFEAECLLPDRKGPYSLLPRTAETAFLHTVLHAERVYHALLDGAYSQIPVGEREKQLDGVLASYERSDPLLKDLVNSAAAVVLAADGSANVKSRIEGIEDPSVRMAAYLRCLPAFTPKETSLPAEALEALQGTEDDMLPLHRAELAAIAIQMCHSSEENVDTAPLLEWGLQQLEASDPLMLTRGLIALSSVAPELRSDAMLERALHAFESIGNPYLRSDALADLLTPALQIGNAAVVSKALERLHDHDWIDLMEGLRRAMPSIVSAAGADVIERMDGAMRRAQAVLGAPADTAAGPNHLDGVLSPELRAKALQAAREGGNDSVGHYLGLFLTESDVPQALHLVQDTRLQGPDDDDDSFVRLHGEQSGFTAWQGERVETISRIVDIRFLFGDASDAAEYHRERLKNNSEGRPEIEGAPGVGEECRVFGGAGTTEVGRFSVTMTAFFYIFRVGRVVVKLFVLQGAEAPEPLALERVRALAEQCAEKIRASPFVE